MLQSSQNSEDRNNMQANAAEFPVTTVCSVLCLMYYSSLFTFYFPKLFKFQSNNNIDLPTSQNPMCHKRILAYVHSSLIQHLKENCFESPENEF